MIRPNELARLGEREAYARVAALFEQLDGYSAAELSMIPVAQVDAEARDELRADVERLADRLGRRVLLDDALEHSREALLMRFVAEFRGKTGGSSPSRDPRNEAAVIRAVSDAIAVAVVEDQLPTADAEALAGPARTLLGDGVADEAVDGGLGEGAAADLGPGMPAGAPTARDWAEADQGATAIDGEGSPRRRGAANMGLVLAIVFVGVPVAAALGFSTGGSVLAIVAGAAVAALAWSFWISGRR